MEPSEHPILMNLLVRLNMLPSSAIRKSGWQQSSVEPEHTLSGEELDDFERSLDEIFEDPRMEVDDRVYLISLNKIREQLGNDWPGSESDIHATVSAVLEARLSERDIYIKYDEISYLVVFSSLLPNEAQLKCAAISEEILRKVRNRKPAGELIDVNKVKIKGNDTVELEMLPNVEDILDATAEQSKAKREPRFAGDLLGTPIKSESAELLEENVKIVFRPLLTVENKIVSTFMCVPIRSVKGEFVSGYDVLDDPTDPIQIFELDLLILETGIREVRSLLRQDKYSLVSVPVHFETLANNRRRVEYLESSNKLHADSNKMLIFEIVELPDSISIERLAELVSLLRDHSRAVMARFTVDHAKFPDFDSSGLLAVGFDLYSSDEPEQVIMNKMEVFVQNAKNSRMKTYVLGLPSISLYTAAMTEGFDYIAGPILTSTYEKAENYSEFSLDAPYRNVINSPPGA